MKGTTFTKGLMAAVLLTASYVGAEEQTNNEEQTRIEVGVRAFSHAEQVKIQEERAARTENQEAQEEEAIESRVRAEVPMAAKAFNAKTYYTSHEGAFHNPVAVSVWGDSVELEDGSIWSIYSADRYKTYDWMTGDIIIILQNTDFFSSFQYKLVNVNTGAVCKTNLSLGPIYNGYYTHWIVALDYLHNEVYLEDGSVWHISGWDTSIMDKWLPNDTVIIGINDDWFTQGSNPNILINVNMDNYAVSNCIY